MASLILTRDERAAAVDAECEAFRQALPALLETHRGQHVVFSGGEAQSFHPHFNAAVGAALRAYGLHTGFAVCKVEDPRPVRIRGPRRAR